MSESRWEKLKEKIRRNIGDYQLNEDLETVFNLNCNEGIYSGQILEGKKSGIGYLKFEDGSKYFGGWKNNKPHGNGYLVFNDIKKNNKNHFYRGEFKHGLYSGEGTYKEGLYFYEGNWESNKKHGVGHECMRNMDNYYGDFFEGKRHGSGIIEMENGGKVEGIFENGSLVAGTYELEENKDNRINYQGYWKNGLFHGEGTLIISSTESHIIRMEGIFVKGEFNKGAVFLRDSNRLEADVIEIGKETKRRILRIDSGN
ncbi:hypothetical protein SteCoe_12384 [Stentor coeruleus]|uniref:MORN repeat protein n=1 Tax=Stentor coeruleus TaxID=5963 RepID=A0A1R2CAZ8_9CILI|nr:hypothetical protein SteCoe_12384 [Stentor coeruleus]